MVKYHESDGYYQRCRATVMAGHGVTGCPLELEGVEVKHYIGAGGVARAGGGKIRRADGEGGYRVTSVSPADEQTGEYSVSGRITTVYGKNDKVIPLKDRERRARAEALLPRLSAFEEEAVDEAFRSLQARVAVGIAAWDAPEGADFRETATSAASMAEKELFTSEFLALLLTVATRDDAPQELHGGLEAVRRSITADPNPREFLIQKAREAKRDEPNAIAA